MARRSAAAEQAPKSTVPQVVGRRVPKAALEQVKPNSWNPNRLSPFEKQALSFGLQKDGWLPSHALTVWGKDKEGNTLNVIIDGEHRWREARALGWTHGPMVFVDGITEAQAKALTIKLDAKRGHFDEDKLAVLLRDVTVDMDEESRALDLGILEDSLARYLRDEQDGGVIGELPSGQKANVKIVPLSFTPERYEAFNKLARELAIKFGKKNVTDTVLEAVRRASVSPSKK